jgi:hypothetical protein
MKARCEKCREVFEKSMRLQSQKTSWSRSIVRTTTSRYSKFSILEAEMEFLKRMFKKKEETPLEVINRVLGRNYTCPEEISEHDMQILRIAHCIMTENLEEPQDATYQG